MVGWPMEQCGLERNKIGEISVPGNSAQEITRFTVDVSKFVDHLDKKHAIFLLPKAKGEKNFLI